MIERMCWALLALLALLHAPPAVAAFSPALIVRLYGVDKSDAAFLLLQHRAALFAAILVVCAWAAADASVRRLAAIATAVSMISFLLLFHAGGKPPALRTIAIADWIGLLPLAFVAFRAFATPGR